MDAFLAELITPYPYMVTYYFSDHPIKQNVKNWSDVNSIIEYLLEVELQVNAREHPVLLTETGLISKKQREKLTEVR